ncbi:GntR family transcriptional regulator [Pseudorhodoferax sp.]|uniref:GntR family transcriptional regulator n=1 Tax=Pseudorhodoferax sp. TaxID=1993553 RepID=UPI002DD65CA9|nr:GntR family transcriptional regulator [Pseudorhodoferax sp.]
MSATLFLSAADATPMYRQIVDQIAARVMAGDWAPGSALPSIRELAAANGVSVITVKRAYLELEHAGVIVTRHGKGSFVADSTDPTRARLHGELLRQIDALLLSAERLGFTTPELQDLIATRRAEGDPS